MKLSATLLSALPLALVASACSSTAETARRDALTNDVGVYTPAPEGSPKLRIGVPSFGVQDKADAEEVSRLAADQAATLCMRTERFEVVERNQLAHLLKEQGLEGIVAAPELARAAQVRGVEYLLLGKVTNLRVKSGQTEAGFDLASIPIPGAAGAVLGLFGFTKSRETIRVECGVDLRLVDPASGVTVVADFAEFQREDTIDALGLKVLGARADASAAQDVGVDNQGKILRLALDECLKKMLPRVDSLLATRRNAGAAPDQNWKPVTSPKP